MFPVRLNATELLRKQRVEVVSEGDLVVLRVGNAELRMPYETALQLSAWMRFRAKEAKRRAGDVSRHWSVLAQLERIDAEGRPW